MLKRLLFLVTVTLLLAACSLADTGQRNTDSTAAQSFLPDPRANTTFANYDQRDVDFAQDAIATSLQGISALTGNLMATALINRFNTLVNCYQERGALDAKLYTQKLNVIAQGQVPIAGFLLVVNQNRVADNFLNCVTQNPVGDVFGAQSAQPEPCVGNGSFVYEGETISFVFAATDTPLCQAFATHFNAYGASTTVTPIQNPSGAR
ncbi:MAG: hypothetical protein SF029_02900 [bacterium]|nr:hypothetical protein [bacterium]